MSVMFGSGREAIDRVAWTVVEEGAGIGGGAATAVAGESRFTAHREAKMKVQMSEADACQGDVRDGGTQDARINICIRSGSR
jgi:hypothetical protein